MSADSPGREDVVDIEIQRAAGVKVTYGDGAVLDVAVETLRAICPCATCRGMRERGQDAWPKPGQPATITITDAELVGAWGLSIRWSDGHDTGIYAWSVLREWWDAGHDGPLVTDPVPGA
ncbi:MAG: DUF971 domain-containing protein [Ilumatobacteraceae bacterium]